MPYDIKITEKKNHIRVEVLGKTETGKVMTETTAVWNRVADVCIDKKQTTILSVWNVPDRLSTVDAYEFANNIDKISRHYFFKLALVHLDKERFKDSQFAETVAVNRGYRVKVFDDERNAGKWLLCDK